MNDETLIQPDLVYNMGPHLRSLWVEIPPQCHLNCPYCFAKINGQDKQGIPLPLASYRERILEPFVKLGGIWVGVPGAGEPFHKDNLEATKAIVEACGALGVKDLVIFTAGDLIDEQLAQELLRKQYVKVMVKWNSSDPQVQNALVRPEPGYDYYAKRQVAWDMLLQVFTDCRHRLGLVTSILSENYTELKDLLERARKDRVVFDCDTLLPKGRGLHCPKAPTAKVVRETVRELQALDESLGYRWGAAGAYIAAPCTRYLHHLFVDYQGNVYPCLGAFDISLGNVQGQALDDIWAKEERKAIAHRSVWGACAACEQLRTGACASCLGRNAIPEKSKCLARGCLSTRPCALFVPSLPIAMDAANYLVRQELNAPHTLTRFLDKSLENLWDATFVPDGSEGCVPRDPKLVHGLPDLPKDDCTDKERANWFRHSGIPLLLSDESPFALLGGTRDGYLQRIVVSPEGYPIIMKGDAARWVRQKADPSLFVQITGMHAALGSLDVNLGDLWIGVRTDAAQLLRVVHARDGQDGDDSILLDAWQIEAVPERGQAAMEIREPAVDKLQPSPKIRSFTFVSRKRGARVALASAWSKIAMPISEVPYLWDTVFDQESGRITTLSDTTADFRGETSTILPRVLSPLVRLVCDKHNEECGLEWILWLFYDPCNNAYFRRLMDFRRQRPSDDWRALRLLYLWPDRSRGASEALQKAANVQSIMWFDANILNLSDFLRGPPTDYELVAADDPIPDRALAVERFSIGPVLALPGVEQRSKNLLDKIGVCPVTPEDVDILSIEPLSRADSVALPGVHERLAKAFESMSAALFSSGDNTEDVYGALPRTLADRLERRVRPTARWEEIKSDFHRRVANYFVFLGALRKLGGAHYFVGQMHTHSYTSKILGSTPPDEWSMTPSGFIAASAAPVTDAFVADLRQAYTSVMTPIVEQYAKWASDYQPERSSVRRSMPCLQRLPRHYVKALETTLIHPDPSRVSRDPSQTTAEPNAVPADDAQAHAEDLAWLRRLPKADLHVHLGPAIPLPVLFDLAVLSLSRWAGMNKEKEEKADTVCKVLWQIVDNALTATAGAVGVNSDTFKDAVCDAAKTRFQDDSIISINAVLDAVAHQTKIEKNVCVWLFTGLLGILIRKKDEDWVPSLQQRVLRLIAFSRFLDTLTPLQTAEAPSPLDAARHILSDAYLANCGYALKKALTPYSCPGKTDRIEIEGFATAVAESIVRRVYKLGLDPEDERYKNARWEKHWGDPLSALLSIPWEIEKGAKGLGRYLGGSDLTGGPYFQFYETLVLAVAEALIHAAKTDNVRYIEFRLSPTGLLGDQGHLEDMPLSVALLASAFVTDAAVVNMLAHKTGWLGEAKENAWPYILGEIVLVGKRGGDERGVRRVVQLAVDSRNRYSEARTRFEATQSVKRARIGEGISGTVTRLFHEHGVDLIIPRVVGVDLVGRERGIRHADYAETMREAFDKCILTTIHAGEDEGERSIWEAIFALHAQRIGHGLRMSSSENLKNLIRDRRIAIELCPTSNQYTNGFDYRGDRQYVYRTYREQHITLAIGSDDPWISYRLRQPAIESSPPYPLSDEYLLLPLLFRKDAARAEPGEVSRAEVLALIFNGFDNAFLPAPVREALISLADLELFLVIRRYDLGYEPYEIRELKW